jgi:ABC-type nitrate/sulfonate/bicarbonate transport system substrate-binding protein
MGARTGLDRRSFLAAGAAAALTLDTRTGSAQAPQKLKSVYPTRSGSSWTMWIAKEAGFYEKYGLDVTPNFGVHPVGIAGLISGEIHFTNYSLDDVAAASVRDPVLVTIGGLLRRGSFALMARAEIKTVQELKGKRMGVGRVGDPPYHYTVGLFKEYGLKSTDVQWVPTGTDAAARVTMLISGQIDAALVTPPAWYRLEAQGLKPLTLMEEHEKIVLTVGNTFRKTWVAANPDAPERILRAQAEAIKVLYSDKAAAIAAYRKYDKAVSETDAARVYDSVVRLNIVDRIPLMQRASAAAVVDRIGADIPALKTFDFQQCIDNRPVRKLIDEGFYVKVFGDGIKAEQDRLLKAAFA